jgi:hypothetical protein
MSMFEDDQAAIQIHVQVAQLKPHFRDIEHVLLFRNHVVFGRHLMVEQDGGHAG